MQLIQIPGYRFFFHKSRKDETRGGVAIYIKDTLKVKLKEDLCTFCEGEFQSIFREITSNKKNTIIGEIYRVPTLNRHGKPFHRNWLRTTDIQGCKKVVTV